MVSKERGRRPETIQHTVEVQHSCCNNQCNEDDIFAACKAIVDELKYSVGKEDPHKKLEVTIL